ncbi:MAG: phosphoribosyltransferase [Acidobacteriota bacterium]
MIFRNRHDAGRRLARSLSAYAGRQDVVVLALPRGGVPVGFEVAAALGVPLDVFLVRKLGAPGQPELAMGAIASGGARVLDRALVARLGVSAAQVAEVEARELKELERRERAYRGDRPAPPVAGRTVILVDDGVATGASLKAAIAALRGRGPAAIVAAVPVAPSSTRRALEALADEVVCVASPEPFYAVGNFYEDFGETGDEEVRELLARAGRRAAVGAAQAAR